MLKTTLIAALLFLFGAGGALADPPSGSRVNLDLEMVLVCDTKEQIADIGIAALDGLESAMEAFKPYNNLFNERGERVCILQALTGMFAIGEAILIGPFQGKGKKLILWAVNIMEVTGATWWIMWEEVYTTPKPTGFRV